MLRLLVCRTLMTLGIWSVISASSSNKSKFLHDTGPVTSGYEYYSLFGQPPQLEQYPHIFPLLSAIGFVAENYAIVKDENSYTELKRKNEIGYGRDALFRHDYKVVQALLTSFGNDADRLHKASLMVHLTHDIYHGNFDHCIEYDLQTIHPRLNLPEPHNRLIGCYIRSALKFCTLRHNSALWNAQDMLSSRLASRDPSSSPLQPGMITQILNHQPIFVPFKWEFKDGKFQMVSLA